MSGFIIPDWPAPANVRAIVTTREGGMSSPPFASFNLAMHVGDDAEAVAGNRQRLRERIVELPAEPSWLTQVHGTRCVAASELGADGVADASYCGDDGHVCAILTADCIPVLICDDAGTQVAAAHAGWRGLAAGVLENTVAALRLQPSRLMAWLGPGIGPAAFEVGADVRSAFLAADPGAEVAFVSQGEAKWLCDLYMLARLRLRGAGVARIYGGGFCTYRDAERFFSHRRDGPTGRMAALVWRV